MKRFLPTFVLFFAFLQLGCRSSPVRYVSIHMFMSPGKEALTLEGESISRNDIIQSLQASQETRTDPLRIFCFIKQDSQWREVVLFLDCLMAIRLVEVFVCVVQHSLEEETGSPPDGVFFIWPKNTDFIFEGRPLKGMLYPKSMVSSSCLNLMECSRTNIIKGVP